MYKQQILKMEGKVESEAVDKSEKKHRKRQKKTLSDLKRQIEFYFSGPNLQKDRFLRQRLEEDSNGRVSVEVIASFNKMQAICKDITMVVKAMKMCPSVEVIEDKWVKPAKALEEPKNVDPLTVYVEPLPPDADHDWVKSVFSTFGNVVYVSLPRFKTNKKIKGFAFVEFEKESEAQLAVKSFTKVNADQCGVTEDEKKLEKKTKKRKHKSNSDEDGDPVETTDNDEKQTKDVSKRLDNDSCGELSDEDSPDGRKRRKNPPKADSVKSKKNDNKPECDTTDRKRKRRSEVEESGTGEATKKAKKDDSESEEDEEEKGRKQKKHRKRKRKKKEQEGLPDLKVISKIEWLRLKGEYKQLQRQAMKKTKTNLRKQEVNKPREGTVAKVEHGAMKENWTNEQKTKEGEKSAVLHFSDKALERLPGVVLKYSTKETIQKPALRELFSSIAKVAYLECDENQNTGYARFETQDECEKIVEATKNGSLASVEVEQLTEKEDIEYWEKLNIARKERYQQKKEKKRGVQKIVAKVEARAKKRDHIHFDDD